MNGEEDWGGGKAKFVPINRVLGMGVAYEQR